jgi:hypothetical protein
LSSQRIASVFPSTQGDAKAVLAKVISIRDSDEREDVKLSAKMYAGGLERRIPSLREGGMKVDAAPAPKPDAKPSTGKDKEEDATESSVVANGRSAVKRTDAKPSEAAPAKAEAKSEPKVEVKLASERQRGKPRESDADSKREHVTDGHVVKLADRDQTKGGTKGDEAPKKPTPASKVSRLSSSTPLVFSCAHALWLL